MLVGGSGSEDLMMSHEHCSGQFEIGMEIGPRAP